MIEHLNSMSKRIMNVNYNQHTEYVAHNFASGESTANLIKLDLALCTVCEIKTHLLF